MTFERLAQELEETTRQTAALVDAVGAALSVLSDRDLSADAARQRAATMIVMALQGQDRIAQRCENLALAVRAFSLLPPDASESDYEEIWRNLTLDELRLAELSGIAARTGHGEAELF